MMQYKFVIVEHTLQYVYLMAIKTLDFSQDFLGEAKLIYSKCPVEKYH